MAIARRKNQSLSWNEDKYAEGRWLIVGLKRAIASLETEQVGRPIKRQLFEMLFQYSQVHESLSKTDNSQLHETSHLYQQTISLYHPPQDVIS